MTGPAGPPPGPEAGRLSRKRRNRIIGSHPGRAPARRSGGWDGNVDAAKDLACGELADTVGSLGQGDLMAAFDEDYTLGDATETGDTATVPAHYTKVSTGAGDESESFTAVTFELKRIDGDWRVCDVEMEVNHSPAQPGDGD